MNDAQVKLVEMVCSDLQVANNRMANDWNSITKRNMAGTLQDSLHDLKIALMSQAELEDTLSPINRN